MITLHLLLLSLALTALTAAALDIKTPRANLLATGLALWVLAELLKGVVL